MIASLIRSSSVGGLGRSGTEMRPVGLCVSLGVKRSSCWRCEDLDGRTFATVLSLG